MSEIEYSTGQRKSDFPSEWGTPPGSTFSEERAAWVARNVRRLQANPEVRLSRLKRSELDLGLARLDGLADLAESNGNRRLAAQIRDMRDKLS